jgi:signal transduction histidine kinase
VFAALEPEPWSESSSASGNAQQSWHRAIAAMSQLVKQVVLAPDSVSRNPKVSAEVCDQQGIMFCGPAPVFNDLATLAHLKTWIFTPENRACTAFQLPPALESPAVTPIASLPVIPLPKRDPLIQEQFCLIQTPQFCWVAILGPHPDPAETDRLQQFQFSFEPAIVQQVWMALQFRIEYGQARRQYPNIQKWRQQFPVIIPDYRIPTQFARELLNQSPPTAPAKTSRGKSPHFPLKEKKDDQCREEDRQSQPKDVDLLKVLSHEVRTPLTTIQTLARLLLKRTDLPTEVTRRIEAIQRECSGQIDRFGLIFRAMELTHDDCQALSNHLTPISLQELLEENLSRWQTHAARRNLTLDIASPELLPAIAIRDPHLLDQVLTGLIEYLSYSLPTGSHIHLDVALAGPQLKLQLKTQSNETDPLAESPMLKAVGQLLMFQPETGGLSLSLPATKHLFQALGGKLTVRKHHQSEVLTIFLPLGTESNAY